jgi:hypothetical protein
MVFSEWIICCALAFGIVGAHVFLWISNCNKDLESLQNLLSDAQKKTFKTIFYLRLGISIGSFIIAGVLTYFLFKGLPFKSGFGTKKDGKDGKDKKLMLSYSSTVPPRPLCSKSCSECQFIFTWLGLYILFYMLCPKFKSYMMNHVTSVEQSKAWFQVYLCMRKKFIWGFVSGMVVYSFLLVFVKGIQSMHTRMKSK